MAGSLDKIKIMFDGIALRTIPETERTAVAADAGHDSHILTWLSEAALAADLDSLRVAELVRGGDDDAGQDGAIIEGANAPLGDAASNGGFKGTDARNGCGGRCGD
jgi:hypothetical protein